VKILHCHHDKQLDTRYKKKNLDARNKLTGIVIIVHWYHHHHQRCYEKVFAIWSLIKYLSVVIIHQHQHQHQHQMIEKKKKVGTQTLIVIIVRQHHQQHHWRPTVKLVRRKKEDDLNHPASTESSPSSLTTKILEETSTLDNGKFQKDSKKLPSKQK